MMSKMTEAVLEDVESSICNLCKKISAKSVLDIGCWDGRATTRYSEIVGASEVCGIEIFEEPIKLAQKRGVNVTAVDLEDGQLPFEDNKFDLVIVNQVFEHLKNIFTLLAEIRRVLSPGGVLIFSVPNLASFHNRLLMATGMQPTSIRIFGPHLRGFCYWHTLNFLTYNKLFDKEFSVGCGFYPFPMLIGRFLGRLLPSMSHTFVVALRKTDTEAEDWSEKISSMGLQTPFS